MISWHFLKQFWVTLGVVASVVGHGMMLSYTYCLVPALQAEDSDMKIDKHTASWLASALSFTIILGLFVGSFLMDMFGRRLANAIAVIPGLVGWTIIYFSTDITTLLVGRFIGGVTNGATYVIGSAVVGEYTSPANRGIFLNLKTTAVSYGFIATHIASRYLDWRSVAALSAIPFFLTLLNTLTWPESPSWLAAKKRFDESEVAFFWLREKDEDSVREFKALVRAEKERAKEEKTHSCQSAVVVFIKKLTKRDFVKPLCIAMACGLLLEASGKHTFPNYAYDIIGSLNGAFDTKSFIYTLAIDVITAVSSTLSCVVMKMFKRRPFLWFSGISSLSVLCVVCGYQTLVSHGIIASGTSTIPLTLLVVYFSLINLGCTTLPSTLIGEIFPLPHKGLGTAFSGLIICIFLMLTLKFTPGLIETINVSGMLFVHGVCMFIALVYLYFTLPETKNKTLQEIEDFFNGKVDVDRRKSDEESTVMINEK